MSVKFEAQNKLHEMGYVIYRVLLHRSQRCSILIELRIIFNIMGYKTIREDSENMFLYKNKTRLTNKVVSNFNQLILLKVKVS